MDNMLQKTLSTSFSNYYKTLSEYGRTNTNNVYKLLLLSYIEELLSGELEIEISASEYSIIEQSLFCVYGTNCIIPYPEYKNYIERSLVTKTLVTTIPRRTEFTEYRSTESQNLHIV